MLCLNSACFEEVWGMHVVRFIAQMCVEQNKTELAARDAEAELKLLGFKTFINAEKRDAFSKTTGGVQ
jgi:hypothetical protein